jgi:cyclomaltodextrinase / maltogenic alpha-amylase / neopullulanase
MKQALAVLALLAAGAAQAQPVCKPDPLDGRSLYLRGSLNGWAAADSQRMVWACDRWALVIHIGAGKYNFKFGDEGWSTDADFGAAAPDATRALLKSRGGVREFNRRLTAGTYRITLTGMNQDLKIESCPLDAAPLGATTLFLRGTMNNWAALDDAAFQYSCDAYYLNIDAKGRHEFKIADAAWTAATSYGAGTGAYLKEGGGNVEHTFTGAHTLRLAWAGGRPELSIGPKTFADRNTVAVTDPVARSLAFDSRSTTHKRPFGAVVAGTTIDFAIDALAGVAKMTLVVERRRLEGNQEVLEYTELARVPMSRALQGAKERWTASHRFAAIGVYGYWFEAELADGSRYVFQNNRDAVHWTREKGSGGAGEVGELPKAHGTVRRFRQTVYAADFKVPDWAPDIVYYYIFPERFRNGDKSNDPKVGRDKVKDSGIEVHTKWTDRPFRPGSGDGSDAVHSNDFFGGDLAGIIDKLDYIRELGANTIYMTPVFQAPSNHKYDTADYTRIDPAFGSVADFERLTREAAKRGIRIIPDTSLNHVGSDSTYFNRFGNFRPGGAFDNGRINPASPYASWFSFDATQSAPDKQYKGWVGIDDLPELNKASPAWRDFAYRKRDSVMKLWLDRGAAGWRMDVAPWVPDDFWREWRTEIKRHRPGALTVSETWFDSSKYLLGDMFDSTMNYIFRNAVLEYAAGGSAKAFVAQLEAVREAYPPQAHSALMNLLSTHDAARALHQFGFHDEKDAPATIARAKQRLLLAVFIQMTYPGAPTIYYGDEVGVTGGEDPFNRATYPWEDEGGQPDRALLAEFKKLTALRHAHPILRRGELFAPLHVDEQVVVHARRLGTQWALTVTNNGATSRRVTVALPPGFPDGVLTDPLGGSEPAAVAGQIAIDVPALAGRLLVTR